MRHPVHLSVVLIGQLLTAGSAIAQQPFDFAGRGPYRADVPRPDAILGYAAGARHTQYAEQRAVLDAMVAAATDRVRIERIGVTEEGRVMRALIVSAPENIARLDAIRTDLARLADAEGTSPDEVEAIIARTPAAVMLTFSIHGNEPAGFEAAMWVAYQLLASEETATVQMLEGAVVILLPSGNPDGHERFAVWSNSLAVGANDPFAYEWNEPWGIWGRYGHYRFDMNRDFIALSQAPTRAMLRTLMRWYPQVYVDLHSTTEQYYFPPPAPPVNPNLPLHSTEWLEVFGRANADAFDRYGWQYFTRDVFDLFYAGYFDAGPSLHGATGMTYESDGGKVLARRREDGTVITFADGIAHHVVAALATIETAAAHREGRLADYYAFHRTAIENARGGRMRRVIVVPAADPTNAARLAVLLMRQNVRVSRLTEPYTAPVHDYLGGADAPVRRRTIPAGAYVVDLAQSEGRIARALLEPRTELDTAFYRRQVEKYERNRRRGPSATSERYEFYDVTAWSLPLTMGLEAYWTGDDAALEAEVLALPDSGDAVRTVAPAGSVTAQARSAYVFPNDRQAAAELALALVGEGFVLNVSTEPIRADGRSYPRGTFVARTSRNAATLHERIPALAVQIGVPVTAVQSAFPDSGQIGIGSNVVEPVFRPRILVAAGDGISLTSYGALWHFMEQELRYPFVPIALQSIARMNTLSDYNVFIVPSGSSSAIRRALGSAGIARLSHWVRDGGVLIAYDGAALFPGHDDVKLSSVKALEDDAQPDSKKATDSLPSSPTLTPPLASPEADPDRPERVPGSIFRATLDLSHWLTMGYERSSLPVMIRGGTRLAPSTRGDNPVVFVGDSLLLAGFAWPGNTEETLQRTVWAAAEEQGRGNVVVFADDPLYRAFWRGPARLLTNAMLFGTGR